ncbi:hypothetical protein HALLA_09615 [Halostagnicola larsenii XH-48]|uniref:Uncharacterized protein n=1 Tax=Halostagnicola larsenii XH-48 TaxID=797299 RepID=W0JUB9_9EURY|nr:hypothetical protein [Halostagnicola larsenii]AHG00830.1 hypothetical protein HALLA_09450 [Halostagnicola larsenii XH-48]AHG00849.1 hypothetical protein HALLA_09615 [Halostagnicola larsenii XH-48]
MIPLLEHGDTTYGDGGYSVTNTESSGSEPICKDDLLLILTVVNVVLVVINIWVSVK